MDHAVFGQRVQLLPYAAVEPGHLAVRGGQLAEGRGHVIAVRLDLVDRAEPVQRPQHPQVGDVVVAAGEIEQPEPVADRERVEVQRVPPAPVRTVRGSLRHRLALIPRIVHACLFTWLHNTVARRHRA
ncbi:MAG: hypothetical protein JO242_07675 [Streptosporangiaceae bacterium]|nr:hypothetical protein [Streptosporangiaceae bacterium]